MSQKQLSGIIGIGTSFISQIETGKDPMPGYIPDRLASVYGQDEVDKYNRIEEHSVHSVQQPQRRRYAYSTSQNGSLGMADANASFETTCTGTDPGSPENQRIDRLLDALERRDDLAAIHLREYERQGARIDDILAMIRNEVAGYS
jgi:transcriptional regulator with XRE-family HTH domain